MEPFLEIPSNRGRRPRYLLIVTMLVLLVVVIFAVAKIFPLGPMEGLSSRRASRKMAEAQRLEDQTYYYMAVELYEQICADTHIKAQLRMQAALHLADLYREHLVNPAAAEAALEKAIYFAPPGTTKVDLRKQLEILRGRPLPPQENDTATVAKTKAPADQPPPAASTAAVSLPLPRDTRVIARIGGETVSLEEILYAWSQFNGNQSPTKETLEPFAKWYFDMALLADEAHRRGWDERDRVVLNLRVQRILALNQMLTQQMIEGLKVPDAKTLEEYYTAHKEAFAQPARVTIGHLVVGDIKNVRTVGKALNRGERLEKLAQQYSLDAKALKDGFTIGQIGEQDAVIPHIGDVPGLASRLAAYSDGVTTGPIQTPSGYHWIKILKKTPAQAPSFQSVRDQVIYAYQKQQLAQARLNLLKSLHKDRADSIVIYNDRFKEALATKPSAGTNEPAARMADKAPAGPLPAATPVLAATPAPKPAATPTSKKTSTKPVKPVAKKNKEAEQKPAPRDGDSGDGNND